MSEASAPGNSTSLLRVMNQRAVYEKIRLLGPVSRPQVAEVASLSKPTVSLALADLERAGLVRVVGQRTGRAGRAAQLYEIHPEAGWVIGIDVGRSWVRTALADLSGEVVVRRDLRSRARSVGPLVDQLAGLVHDLAVEAGIADEALTHIVLGMPGVHDTAGERLLLAPNLPGWERPGVTRRLREKIGVPCTIENDIDLAALGEQAYGLGADKANFVFVSLGTGVGMGIVVNGSLYRGARGAAGEIAFLPFGETEDPGYRQHGLLESVASAPGVVATAERLGMSGRITAKRVFDLARDGDEIARRAVAVEADHLAHGLASVVAVLDPELIVLGGGIGGHGSDVLLGAVRETMERLTPLGTPRIEVSPLADDAVVLGTIATALAVARDRVFTQAIKP